jgi:hypothetical protein
MSEAVTRLSSTNFFCLQTSQRENMHSSRSAWQCTLWRATERHRVGNNPLACRQSSWSWVLQHTMQQHTSLLLSLGGMTKNGRCRKKDDLPMRESGTSALNLSNSSLIRKFKYRTCAFKPSFVRVSLLPAAIRLLSSLR